MATRSLLTVAPPFQLPTQKGDVRSLQDYLAKGPVLLAFHRGVVSELPAQVRRLLTRAAVDRGMQVVTVVAQTSGAVRRYVRRRAASILI